MAAEQAQNVLSNNTEIQNKATALLETLKSEQSFYEALQNLETFSLNISKELISNFDLLTNSSEYIQKNPEIAKNLFEIIELSKINDKIQVAAANAITLLNWANVSLANINFDGIKIPGADLQGTNLSNTSFKGADLRGVNLSNSYLRGANLAKANMESVQFGEGPTVQNGSEVTYIAFSSDETGEKLILGDKESNAKEWRIQNGKWDFYQNTKLDSSKKSLNPTWSAVPNGDYIIVIKNENNKTWILKGHKSKVLALEFSPNGKILASASADNTVKLWNPVTRKCIKTFQGHTNDVTCLTFSPDGKKLFSGSADGTARVWHVQTEFCTKPQSKDVHANYVRTVLNLNAQLMASCGDDKTIKIWNKNGECLQTLKGHTDKVLCLATFRDGEILVSGGEDKTLRLWKRNEKGLYQEIKCINKHQGAIYSIQITPDGRMLSSSCDGTINLWNLDGQLLKTLNVGSPVSSAVFSSDMTEIISGSWDGTIRRWDIRDINTAEQKVSFDAHNGKEVTCVIAGEFRIGEKKVNIISSGKDETIKMWDEKNNPISTLEGLITHIEFFKIGNAQMLAVGTRDCKLIVCNLETGEKFIMDFPGVVFGFGVTPEGCLCVGSGGGDVAYYWPEFNEKNQITGYQRVFSTHQTMDSVVLKDCNMEDVVGLGASNRVLVSQKEAMGKPVVDIWSYGGNYSNTFLPPPQPSANNNNPEPPQSGIHGPK